MNDIAEDEREHIWKDRLVYVKTITQQAFINRKNINCVGGVFCNGSFEQYDYEPNLKQQATPERKRTDRQ